MIIQSDQSHQFDFYKLGHISLIRAQIRKLQINRDKNNDETLFSLLTSNPSSAYKVLKAAKTRSAVQVPYIKVGNKKYPGERVIDGFYESLLSKPQPQHNTTQRLGLT